MTEAALSSRSLAHANRRRPVRALDDRDGDQYGPDGVRGEQEAEDEPPSWVRAPELEQERRRSPCANWSASGGATATWPAGEQSTTGARHLRQGGRLHARGVERGRRPRLPAAGWRSNATLLTRALARPEGSSPPTMTVPEPPVWAVETTWISDTYVIGCGTSVLDNEGNRCTTSWLGGGPSGGCIAEAPDARSCGCLSCSWGALALVGHTPSPGLPGLSAFGWRCPVSRGGLAGHLRDLGSHLFVRGGPRSPSWEWSATEGALRPGAEPVGGLTVVRCRAAVVIVDSSGRQRNVKPRWHSAACRLSSAGGPWGRVTRGKACVPTAPVR